MTRLRLTASDFAFSFARTSHRGTQKTDVGIRNWELLEFGRWNAEVEESAMVNENPQKMAGFGFEKCGSGFQPR